MQMRDQCFLSKCNFRLTYIDAMLSVLVNRHLTAVEVSDIFQFLEISMAVAAKDKIYVP